MNAERTELSQNHILEQTEALLNRVPELLPETVRFSGYNFADAIKSIDAKVDTMYGDTKNIQYKHRSNESSDFAIPIKLMLLNNLQSDCAHLKSGSIDYYFYPDVKAADIFVLGRGNLPPLIITADQLQRIFYKKEFSSKEIFIMTEKQLSGRNEVVDISKATAFISPKTLASIMLTDYLNMSFGSDFYTSIKGKSIDIHQYLN